MGKIWADSTGRAGHVISWDNGQTWVRETVSMHADHVPKQTSKARDVNLNPTTSGMHKAPTMLPHEAELEEQRARRHHAYHDLAHHHHHHERHERGEVEREREHESDHSHSSDEENEDWKNYSHGAVTHIPDVLKYYLYRDSIFTWKIIDISHITPMRKYDGTSKSMASRALLLARDGGRIILLRLTRLHEKLDRGCSAARDERMHGDLIAC